MRYNEFAQIISPQRMNRYRTACGGDSKKAMRLYRLNLRLSQEMFTVISCFEIALRNAIDVHYVNALGPNWLQDAIAPAGRFTNQRNRASADIIRKAKASLRHGVTHNKLVAELTFGFWRFLYAQPQYYAAGSSLLGVFPAKPRSTPAIQYNHTYIFNELAKVNDFRNRLAHHEPICFLGGHAQIDTRNARQHYALILQLFNWMNVNESALLYGLDHILSVANEIDSL